MTDPSELSPKEAAFGHVGRRQKVVETDTVDTTTVCEVCGKDLTDPKNAGDLDENGDWVCIDWECREIHNVPMTCDRQLEEVDDDE